MTVSHKVTVSLLIAVVLFAGFAALAFTGLFQLVEARFYNPTVAKGLERELAADAEVTGAYFTELRNRFAAELAVGEIKRSFLPNQSAEDVFERSKRFGLLTEETSGLQSVRFVDAAGKRIHFSTSRGDELKRDKLSVAYRNYGEAAGELPVEEIAVAEGGAPRLVVDPAGERFLFAFPFLDSFDVYKGTAVFAVSVRGLAERLTAEGRLRVGEDLSLVSAPAGVVSGLPRLGRADLVSAVAAVWSDGTFGPTPLASGDSGTSFALISAKTRDGFIAGRLVNESVFAFPSAMKGILLGSFFLTVFLVVFLLFNLRQDSLTVIRDRIKRFQIALMEEYYDRKGDLDWNRWKRELEQRREEVRAELKRDLRGAVPKRLASDVDELIDKSWDELLSAIGGKMAPITAQLDEGKLQDILGRVMALAPAVPAAPALKSKKTAVPKAAAPAPAAKPAAPVGVPAAAEEPEELAEAVEVSEAVEVEELEEVEPAEAEALGDVEELEEIAEASEVEELEEIAEPVEAVEVAEVEEFEEVEELEEAEPVEAEELQELAESAEAEEPESVAEAVGVEELEEVEELPEAGSAVEVAEGAEFGETEAAAEVEELEEAELAEDEELEEFEELEELAERVELGEVEDLEEVAEGIEPEEVDALEEVSEEEEEELAEAEPVAVAEGAELEEIAEPVEAVEVAEVEEFEEVEELEEAELAEDEELEEFEELEELAEAEAVAEAGEIDEVEELEEAEPAEAGELEEVAEAVELEEVAEAMEELEAADFFDELEEAADVEELDEVAEETEVSLDEFGSGPTSAAELDRIARDIDFAPIPEAEDAGDLPAMEVVSPFTELLSELESGDVLGWDDEDGIDGVLTEDGVVDDAAPLEPMEPIAQPYRLFSSPAVYIEPLELIADAAEELPAELLAEEDDAIEVRDGVPYVSSNAGESFPDAERFDPELRQLVDSVIARQRL